jgi:uncharacterized protein YegL
METSPKDQESINEAADLAARVARIFGYEGLRIQVRPGTGWSTLRDEHSVTLNVDPNMLSTDFTKDITGKPLDAAIKPPEQYSVYGICHELGHIEDFLHPSNTFEVLQKRSNADNFFWNVLDDAVINRRLRNIPLLNGITDAVYKDILFPVDDYSKEAKHLQFMYGLLLKNVTPDREVTLSEDVQEALDKLEDTRIGIKKYDLYDVLAHPDTDLDRRRRIAERYILPVYHDFLEEDKRQQKTEAGNQSQSNSGSNQQGGGASSPQQAGSDNTGSGSQEAGQGQDSEGDSDSGKWEQAYKNYKESSHCGAGNEHHEEKERGSSNEQDIHDAIQEAGKGLREQQAEATQQAGMRANKSQSGGNGAGSIAEELQISPDNAALYAQIINELRPQIHEVSEIFQLLTVPAVEYTSPRYRRHVSTAGSKLSPRDIFRVVVAQHSAEEPAVWWPVETIAKKEGFSFNGLDISLVVDVSGSMEGSKARSAAACAVMLMEGLEAARRNIQLRNPHAPKPDVRMQTIVFGGSEKVIAPMTFQTPPAQKGSTFTTILNADSSSTLVSKALNITVAGATQNPQRTQLVYLITDGDFYDHDTARRTIARTGSNYHLYEYIVQSPGTTPIVKTATHIANEHQLPMHLRQQLRRLASQLLT